MALLLLAAAMAAAAAAKAIFSGAKAAESALPALISVGELNPVSTKFDPGVEPPAKLEAAGIGGGMGRMGEPKPNWAELYKTFFGRNLQMFKIS